MDDKQIKISSADVEVTWDEVPEVKQVPAGGERAAFAKAMRELSDKCGKEARNVVAQALGYKTAAGIEDKDVAAATAMALELINSGHTNITPSQTPTDPSKPLESQGNAPSEDCGAPPKPKSKEETLKLREAWLREAYQRITGQEGVISCGYGKGGSRSSRGYSIHKDETGINQIFIHPSISKKDGALVALFQAAGECGLKALKDLNGSLQSVGSAMPAYPQHKLAENDPSQKKDGIRQLKVVCPVCGYTARTSRKWLDEAGPPYCPQFHTLDEQEKAGIAAIKFSSLSDGVGIAIQMVEADKPIEVDLETESIEKSGNNLEVKTKKKE